MPRIITPRTKINKESLTTKSTLIFIGLTAICGGYLLFLAIAAPQQLAEATTAATNVVCSGCVGSSDIADNSILSADIANGRIFSEDIRDGQVGSVDIGTGQVASVDIQDNGITSADLGNVVTIVQGGAIIMPGQTVGKASADCPSGKILTGGGFLANGNLRVEASSPLDANTWSVRAFNAGDIEGEAIELTPYALCV